MGGADVVEFAGEHSEAVAEVSDSFEPSADLEDAGAVGRGGCAS